MSRSHGAVMRPTRWICSVWMLAAVVLSLGLPAAAQEFGNVLVSVTAAGRLEVAFSVRGLTPGEVIVVRAEAADVSASYACGDAAGVVAPNANARTETSNPVIASAQVRANAGGVAVGTIGLTPPQSGLRCPPGNAPVLLSVSFGSVDLATSNGAIVSAAGSFDRTFVEL